ncbi:alpha/beta hydrolase-fold protein [Lolliginicoccus suaedae]|uniref:alpha/beta hydrolase-fold protein n=1 Tax=Lolliginicoccus suaedae TaxID=2605429 RepID=UPI0011EEC4F6|nr:alpha/beta hydrolase-fold protein [Lolliginicoccus suaedae]
MRPLLQRDADRAINGPSRARRRKLAASALAVFAPIALTATTLPSALASPAPQPAQALAIHPAAPAMAPVPGVRVERVDRLSDRHLALWVYSPAMNTTIQVQVLLARDFHAQPQWTFPGLYLLDGLRARDDQSGWTLETDVISFFQDKNINVVMPVGGESSFYTDWLEPDNDKNYKWETFLTEELPPILRNDYRINDSMGVLGLSMGGTAAMLLPARNRGMFQFAGSLSGYLSTTSYGMQRAIKAAVFDAGGYDADAMWGTADNPLWKEHDPYLLARNLKGMSLYMSAGTGAQGAHDTPGVMPGIPQNSAGMALEVLSRLTTQNFAARLKQLNIPATVRFRNTGTHSWPYWQSELHEAWPQIATALNVDSVGLNRPVQPSVLDEPTCEVIGAIGDLVQGRGDVGVCLTDERTTVGGKYQEFENATAYWSPETGAHLVEGEIEKLYEANSRDLGFPTTSEAPMPDGRGAFNHFEDGSIYWTPAHGAVMVIDAFRDEWAARGWESGPLGIPVAAVENSQDRQGRLQRFANGALFAKPRGSVLVVEGEIWRRYEEAGRETGALGWPVSSEHVIGDGRFTEFENGNVYWSPGTGAWPVLAGPIMDAWATEGFEAGRLGYPVGAQHEVPEGVRQDFQGGFVLVKDGVAEVVTS